MFRLDTQTNLKASCGNLTDVKVTFTVIMSCHESSSFLFLLPIKKKLKSRGHETGSSRWDVWSPWSVGNAISHNTVAFVESRGAGKVLWESEAGAPASYAAIPRLERPRQLRLRVQKEKAEKGPQSSRAGRYWTLGSSRHEGWATSTLLYTRFTPPTPPSATKAPRTNL